MTAIVSKQWFSCFLLTAFVVTVMVSGSADAKIRIMVAVGNNHGIASDAALQFADDDANHVASLFSSVGDVAQKHLRVVLNQSPSSTRRAIAWAKALAAQHRHSQVQFLFYYSGHGGENALHMSGSRLLHKELKKWVDSVPAHLRLMVIDACRTADATQSKGYVKDKPFELSVSGPKGPGGTVVIRSSSVGEAAQESERLAGAVFTHYWLSGLRGGADRNADTLVTLQESYSYAYGRTLMRSAAAPGSVQHPAMEVDVSGAGLLVLTRTASARSNVVIPAGSNTEYLIYHVPAGTLMAHVWSRRKQVTRLALPRGRFVVQRRGDGINGIAEFTLAYGGTHQLQSREFRPMAYEVLVQKGGGLLARVHEMQLGYDFVLGQRGGVGHGLALQYALRWPKWSLGFGVTFGGLERQSESHDITEQWIGTDVGVYWRPVLGPLTLTVGGGAMIQYWHQELRRLDANRVEEAGYNADSSFGALGAGPVVRWAARIPLGNRWWWSLGTRSQGLVLKEGDSPSLRWVTCVESNIGLEW